MKNFVFCEYCECEREYRLKQVMKTSNLKGEEISYMAKEAICNICNNEIFVSEICDENLVALYDEYRNRHNIIEVDKINDVIIRYLINEKALNLLLGLEESTISRYLDGNMPTSNHSDILKKIYEDPRYYLSILQNNKDRIKIIDYNKSRKMVENFLNNCIVEEKIDSVIKYILDRCEDLTHNAIQKLLYYVQAFYYVFTDEFIFNEDCEAYVDGPVYRSVFMRYEEFGFDKINNQLLNNDKLVLNDDERNVVESVIKFYSCYSGKILRQMTQNESPWILTRPRKAKDDIYNNETYTVIEKNHIGQYFSGVKEKYGMITLLDIEKYSKYLFGEIFM